MISEDQTKRVFAEIDKARTILLHCHPHPDGDSLGSALGFYHALKSLGKKVTVIKGDSDKPKYLSFLPGFAAIEEKNYFEIDSSQFDLFIILDAAAPGQISKHQEVVFPDSLNTIVIDHHVSNPGFARLNIVDAGYPATAQMVYDLFRLHGLTITPDIAACLFVGIYTDTGGFRFSHTTVETFAAATELVRILPDFGKLLFELDSNNTAGRLHLTALLLNSIETWQDNSIAVASASWDEMQTKGISREDMAGNSVANDLKTVPGWNISVTFIEEAPGKVKVSFRTRDESHFDVSKVATALGGGGHKGAAGVTLEGSIESAKAHVKGALLETYPNL